MGKPKRVQIVSSAAREAVGAFFQLLENPETLLNDLGPIAHQLERLGMEAVPALIEALSHEDPRARIMAAWLILHVAGERPGAVEDRRVVAKSARLMIDALQGSDAEQRLWSCLFMTAGHVPKEAVGVLCDILEDPDERLRILAAAALTWCGDEAALALPILGPALGNDNEMLVVIAATAFGRLGMRSDDVQQIISAFPTVQPAAQFHILQSLKQIGPPSACS